MNLINPIGIIGATGLASGFAEAAFFTANGNFTPKVTGNYVVTLAGGGGSGGGGSGVPGSQTGQGWGGTGGGAGQVSTFILALTAGTSYPIVIGGGGAAQAAGQNGVAGSPSTFNGVQSAAGGVRGLSNGNSFAGQSAFSQAGGTGHGPGGGVGGATANGNPATGGAGSAGQANSGAGGGGGGGSANAGNAAGANPSAGGAGGSGWAFIARA